MLYRNDRPSRGGGVATYVAANLVSDHIIPVVEPVNFECLFVNIIFHENKQLIGKFTGLPQPLLILPCAFYLLLILLGGIMN